MNQTNNFVTDNIVFNQKNKMISSHVTSCYYKKYFELIFLYHNLFCHDSVFPHLFLYELLKNSFDWYLICIVTWTSLDFCIIDILLCLGYFALIRDH